MKAVQSLVLLSLLAAGCSVQRAQISTDAQSSMLGLSKEQVLACMGIPAAKLAEGSTEVWKFDSGDGRVYTSASAFSSTNSMANTTGQVRLRGNTATFDSNTIGMSNTDAHADSVTRKRHCVVNVVMREGRVAQVNYSGPTGGILTRGEQCAYAVQNCVR